MFFLQFKTLPAASQASLVCRHGVHLADRRQGDYLVSLYALFGFYVEVHHRYIDSEVVLITSFYNLTFLDPYRPAVSLGNRVSDVA